MNSLRAPKRVGMHIAVQPVTSNAELIVPAFGASITFQQETRT
jgi:hypothetical protein